ncbi:MAG: glycoside hydrolase family 3 C-terminal domain-containing protein [Ignavibacteriales bacterium]|nr:glycoside hydrolase family 3 C-terminal domain-containing protein [Ignavibacteriales bacterium]
MIEKPLLREQESRQEVPAYKDCGLPVDARLADLLARMTVEEKAAQALCIWRLPHTSLFDDTGKLDHTSVQRNLCNGIGQIARISDRAGGQSPAQMAELTNTLQKFLVEKTRLGIPAIFHEESLHGLVARDATSYPQPIGLASTFNPELVENIHASIAEATRARGAHQTLAPDLDLARDARWGRFEETYGEDPYLVSQMGIAAVRGMQGDGSLKDKERIIATIKHFAAHGQPESGSNCGPGDFSERLLRDTFFFPFREVIRKANALSVMPSYNEIDGVPSHANRWLLQDVLRGEWGFRGVIVSDYFAITELHEREEASSFRVAKDKDEAARLACEAGINVETPDPDCYPALTRLINEGKLKESALDNLISPLLRLKFQLGLFEDPYVQFDEQRHKRNLERDSTIALQAARETITLLKNEANLLPLAPRKNSTIAVIGPNADRLLLGGYSGTPPHFKSVLQGIKEKAGEGVNVVYSEGCKTTIGGSWSDDLVTLPDPEENRKLIGLAVAAAQKSDAVVLVLGDNEQTSREAWSKVHMGDRPDLDLFGMQNELAKAVLDTGKLVILVLFNGRPNSLSQIHARIPAILECWYLGQETGSAVADVLFGNVNPGGKLPVSIPRSAGHIPCFYNHKPSARRGYLFDDITPLYPFGFGLSYTTFSFSNLRLENQTIQKDGSTKVLIDVTNTGNRAGSEVVQMYIRDMFSSVTRPVKELKGFRKVWLGPKESKTVALDILPEHLAFTNIEKHYVVEPGDFEIMVGSSSLDRDLEKTVLHVK